LSGYLLLAQRLIESPTSVAEAWNFGPDDYNARPVSWVIEYLSEHWGQAAGYDLDPRPQPHEAGQLRLDTSKARQRLAWRPRLSLEQTLDWLIAWYRRYYDGDRDMRALTLSQIRDYEAMAPVASTTASGRVGVDIA
jgi:CDP-glucose 4,6-dehydratase